MTIGITCFNAEDTIQRAIESALAQDYPNTEIIIVDDGSSDSSHAVIRSVIQNHLNTRFIIHENNKGFAGALNTIIQEAKGEFIAIFDDDDTSLPERLSTQHKRIIQYEQETGTQYIACWCSGYKQYDNGYRAYFKAIGSKPKIPQGQDLVKCQLYMKRDPNVFFGCGTPTCSIMVRKSTYEDIGPYDESMRRTEDTDFALRLAKKGGHFIGCAEELVIQHASIGHDKRPGVGYQSELNLIEKHKDLFDPPARYGYAKKWIKLRYHHFGGQKLQSLATLLSLFLSYPSWTWEQFLRSAPARMRHEKRMKKENFVASTS